MLSGRPFGNLDIASAGAVLARQTSTVRSRKGTVNDEVTHSMGRTEQECCGVGQHGQYGTAWAVQNNSVVVWARMGSTAKRGPHVILVCTHGASSSAGRRAGSCHDKQATSAPATGVDLYCRMSLRKSSTVSPKECGVR